MLFDSSFFRGNRTRLLERLPDGALVVLAAFTKLQRKGDMAFRFEQEPNFWYLSGIEEPDWLLLIDASTGLTSLVVPDLEEWQRVFDGGIDKETALARSGADQVISAREAKTYLTQTSRERPVYTLFPDAQLAHHGFMLNPAQARLTGRMRRRFITVDDCRMQLKTLRAIKQPPELAAIQAAVDATVASLKDVLGVVPDLKNERDVEAFLAYRFLTYGTEGHAYDPVIAGGANACTLHYGRNDMLLKAGEWLLLDVGAKFQGYAADISRSLPRGTVTARQQRVYQAVVKVHDTAMALCRPGMKTHEYHHAVEAAMEEELRRLGLIRGDPQAALNKYFPHAISHGLGLDVHDSLAGAPEFKPGMVLTVEPGIYIPEEGFGVRIENDIHITEHGPRNLSAGMPYELAALREALAL